MTKSDGAVVIETRLNNDKIDADFKKIDKQTKNMINRYNKSVDSIKKQELALEKVKSKLQDIESGSIVPRSIKSAESELEKLNKELELIDKKANEISNRQETLSFDIQAQKSLGSLGNNEIIKTSELEIQKLDGTMQELAVQEEHARLKASELTKKISELKNNSPEVNQLKEQINNMAGSIEESKKQTNELGKSIKKNLSFKAKLMGISGFDEVGKKVDKLKTRMTRLIGTVAIFSLIRNGLTNLRNGFTSLIKKNDSFSSSLNQIKANLMTAFAPIYNACLPAINSLMNALSKITGTIAVFVSGLFGTSLDDAKKQAEGLSKSLDDTAKSGEKASGSLTSIDNLEVISDNSGSGGSSSKDNIDYSSEITYSQKLLDILEKIKTFVVENKDELLALFAGITAGLLAVKLGLTAIQGLGIGLILAGIVLLVKGIIDFINEPTWENFMTILEGIALVVAGIAVLMGGWVVAIIAVGVAIVAYIIKHWDKCKEILSTVGTWIYDNVIKPVSDFFVGLWEGIKNVFSTVGTWFDNKVISPVVNFFTGMWEKLKDGAKNAWEGIKNVFSTVATFFKNIFSNAWEGVKKVFSVGGKIFDGIKDGIVTAFKTVVNAIITGINEVVSLPFKGLNGILDKLQDISIAGIKPFNWITWRAPVPQIPKLAKGAVIPPRSEFMAILGDQKRGVNIETPLDTMVEAFNKALDERGNGSGDVVIENLTIVAKMGDTEVSKTVVKGVRIAEKKFGKPLFVN